MIKTVWSTIFCVSDLEKAAKFYEETSGLEKKYEYSSYIGFECGGVEIGLIPKLEEVKKVNLVSPSVQFLADDVEKVYKELKNKKVEFIKELHEEPWGKTQATLIDQNGNILEIMQIKSEKYFAMSAEGALKGL